MKQSTTFALSALFAIVSAVPLQKRQQVTTTIIEDVTSTVDVYTTVFVQPGDPRLNQVQQTTVQTTIATPAGTTTLAQSPSTPPSNPAPVVEQQKQALPVVQAPAPTTTPTVTPSSTPPPPPPASTTAAVVQPIVEAPAPIQQQAAPAPVSNPSTSGSSSGSSAPSGGKSCKDGGKCVADHVTTFDGTSGKGACGYVSTSVTMNYVALAVGMMGEQSNNGVTKNPFCDRKIKIKNNGQEYEGIITDKCPGCKGGPQSLDLSPELFDKVFPTAGKTGNFEHIEWYFTS